MAAVSGTSLPFNADRTHDEGWPSVASRNRRAPSADMETWSNLIETKHVGMGRFKLQFLVILLLEGPRFFRSVSTSAYRSTAASSLDVVSSLSRKYGWMRVFAMYRSAKPDSLGVAHSLKTSYTYIRVHMTYATAGIGRHYRHPHPLSMLLEMALTGLFFSAVRVYFECAAQGSPPFLLRASSFCGNACGAAGIHVPFSPVPRALDSQIKPASIDGILRSIPVAKSTLWCLRDAATCFLTAQVRKGGNDRSSCKSGNPAVLSQYYRGLA